MKKANTCSSVMATERLIELSGKKKKTGQRLPNSLEFNLSNGGSHAFTTYLTNPSAWGVRVGRPSHEWMKMPTGCTKPPTAVCCVYYSCAGWIVYYHFWRSSCNNGFEFAPGWTNYRCCWSCTGPAERALVMRYTDPSDPNNALNTDVPNPRCHWAQIKCITTVHVWATISGTERGSIGYPCAREEIVCWGSG